MSLLEQNSTEMRRRASAALAETSNNDVDRRYAQMPYHSSKLVAADKDRSCLEPIKLLPVNQLPRRHSSATTQSGSQVPNTNSQRVPPAVPVRNRKPSSDEADSTTSTISIDTQAQAPSTTAIHGTIAHYHETNPFLPDQHKYGKNNPFVETNICSNETKLEQPKKPSEPYHFQSDASPTPPAIPPPPVRSRRASTAFQNHETYLDPRNSLLNQRRSSSPFQNYATVIENDLSKCYSQSRNNSLVNSPYNSYSQVNSLNNSQRQLNSQFASSTSIQMKEIAERPEPNDGKKLVSQPTIILPNNYHELQKQSLMNKENSQKNKMTQFKITHNTFLSGDAGVLSGGKSPLSPKSMSNHSTAESSSESGLGTLCSGGSSKASPPPLGGKVSTRQDSNVSSDSMSQTSSPSYTTKTMETPLLPHHARKVPNKQTMADAVSAAEQNAANNAALTKSISTPASLQTCVKFSNGSNMTLQHRIIRDMRRPSTNYMTRRRIKFRLVQVMVNAVALMAIAGGLAVYFRVYPTAVRYVNKTVTTTIAVTAPETNPAPGYCFKMIVEFCIHHKVPYNYTTFPNHVVNMNQLQAEQVVVEFCIDHRVPYNYTRFPSRHHVNQAGPEQDLELYDALVDVRCYELSALFLCSVFVPKCGPSGELLYPCKSLCEETKHRCGFFLEVFGLPALPEYLLQCNLLPDSDDPDACVGHKEVKEAKIRSQKPSCSKDGFLCDLTRCVPLDWKCDGHLDCEDQSDEQGCNTCPPGMVHCGDNHCMDNSHKCDGVVDCPYGQDERNCIRLQEKMGDVGRGLLQVFNPQADEWLPACVSNWDSKHTAQAICSLMGYTTVNYTLLSIKDSKVALPPPQTANFTDFKKNINWVKEFRSCGVKHYPVVTLECQSYACGKRRTPIPAPTKRIVGGYQSQPGDWPFLAALLGGPEEIFYCAGVLIADQWVLTASHCVGNYSENNLNDWKIQLGITRRHSHNYYGQKVKIKRIVSHPQYNVGVNHDNDVALFQLKDRVNFNEHLVPVCLPPPGRELEPGNICTVIGWGKSEDHESSEYEPVVHEVEVPVLNRELCNQWMTYRNLNVTDGMICAGYAEGGKDACQGDSGGPLLCPFDRYKDRWFVGGIVSWGIKCAHPHLPGVYAYVPKYVSWIKEMIELHSD